MVRQYKANERAISGGFYRLELLMVFFQGTKLKLHMIKSKMQDWRRRHLRHLLRRRESWAGGCRRRGRL